MTRLLAIVWTVAVLGAFGVPAFADSLLPNSASYDDVMARGHLDIAVYRDFPPFSYRKGGKLVGVDVDLGAEIAKRLGVKANFNELPADETVADDLRNAIWKGHYLGGARSDLMMHVPTERAFKTRQEFVVIFGPYYDETIVMARDLEKTGETPTLAVYRFEKVGVELDSLPDFFLLGFQGGMLRQNVVHFTTVSEAVAALEKGDLAAVFATRSQIEGALTKEGKERFEVGAIFAPGLKDRWSLGVAVNHRSRQLGYAIDDIITAMRTDGTIAEIFASHGLSHLGPEGY